MVVVLFYGQNKFMKKGKKSYKGVPLGNFNLPDPNIFSLVKKRKRVLESISRRHYLRSFTNYNVKGSTKNLLVIYDVPHTMKKERDWFRRQLKSFDFVMIQKSVWVGPSLPLDFTDYVKRIGLGKSFKAYKLKIK